MSESFLNDRVELHYGDCREVLATLAENSLDACVTDPPYHLTSIVQRFGAEDAAPPKFKTGAYGGGFKEENGGTGAAFARMSRGFMGKVWDGGDVAFRPETWAAVYRVLKPGAHLIAMGGTRTYHRLACAIEDAGFEIRDTVSWLYGSGFPKSHDVSKGIDRAAGAERNVVGLSPLHSRGEATSFPKRSGERFCEDGGRFTPQTAERAMITAPATEAAREWQGWGTALKPACELIVLARKPLSEGTVAANVLKWGTGAINVDSCRVGTDGGASRGPDYVPSRGNPNAVLGNGLDLADAAPRIPGLGRWPANVVHDGSDEVVAAFPDTTSGTIDPSRHVHKNGKGVALSGSVEGSLNNYLPHQFHEGDSGSATRFFYTSKADADDRLGSKHPTVKPLDLMQWLVRLVTPPRGLVLDPFAGTGTTGEAAWREGMAAVLIEAEPEYQADIRRRMALALSGPDERQRESIKARNLPRDDGPLFGGSYELPRQEPNVAAEFDDEAEPPAEPLDVFKEPNPVAKVLRDDGPLFASRETWAEMWAKPFDFSQEPRE